MPDRPSPPPAPAREDRLAAALRANLRRRKGATPSPKLEPGAPDEPPRSDDGVSGV